MSQGKTPPRTRRAGTDMDKAAQDLGAALDTIREALGDMEDVTENALAAVSTFCDVALRVMAQTNPSKVRSVARTVEIRARMDGVPFISMHEERA